MKATIAVLPGDGIGPEVVAQATGLLSVIAQKHGHDFSFMEGLIGGIAIDARGDPLPKETIRICESADAILLGAVGGPKWSGPDGDRSTGAWFAGFASTLRPVRQLTPGKNLSSAG